VNGAPTGSDSPGAVAAIAAKAAQPRHGSIEERRRLVADSLQVGNPGNRSKNLPEQADPMHDCQIELGVEEIRLYEHNPRRANNARFAEIKESIRSTGVRNPLTVTRRPGEKHFIVEAGGNTRLLAVQQLWAETRDPRFEKLTALFRPWRSEAHVLSAHLIENEQRGDMTFWDKANGVFALKAQLEQEQGRALSLRQLDEALKAAGFPVNTATLSHYLYATTRLHILGDAVPVLSGLDVKTIQPRLNLMKRYAQMRGGTGEADLYAGVFDPVFRRHAELYRENHMFNASDLCQTCEAALAQHLGENVARLRLMLDALAQSPQASLEAFSETAGSASPNVPALRTPAGGHAPNDVPGVSTANAPPAEIERRDAPRTPVRILNSAPTDPAPLRRLRESIARFAKLESDVPALMRLDAGFFDWLLDGHDEAAAAFWEIVNLARELRSATPQPVEVSAQPNTGAGNR